MFHRWGRRSECATTKNASEENGGNVGKVGNAGHGHSHDVD